MTQLILFGGNHYNPDQIYKVERLVETVTFTVPVGGLPAGSLFEEDIVFGSEAEAITALDDFLDEVNQIKLDDLICCVSDGVLSNSDLTKGFEKTFGLSEATKEERLSAFIVRLAEAIKLQADS